MFKRICVFSLGGILSASPLSYASIDSPEPTKQSINIAGSTEKIAVYRAIKLRKGESLKIMQHPTEHSRVIDFMPYNARWIAAESERKRYGMQYWQEVKWNGFAGWVKSKYLAYDPKASKLVSSDRSCLKRNRAKHCLLE